MTDDRGLIVVQFLVPSTDTRGRPYRRRVFSRLERELAERFGGWSLVSLGPLPGGWVNPETGGTEQDRSWRCEVAVPRGLFAAILARISRLGVASSPG